MHVTREIVLGVAPAEVWDGLWDVPRMVECVPGCVEAREVEPRRRYAARMMQQVGPIRVSVPLDIDVAERGPRSLAVEAKGRDPLIGAAVTMNVTLDVDAADGGSRVRVEADGRVLGKLAALGHAMIQRKAEESIDEFAQRLRRRFER